MPLSSNSRPTRGSSLPQDKVACEEAVRLTKVHVVSFHFTMITNNTPFCNPPQKPIRLACAGLGFIFRNAHAKALKALQSQAWPVEVAMVCDINPAALEDACRNFPSAKPTQNLDDLLGCSKEVDALLICLWPPLGLKVLRQAMERGFKKILIEKPVSHHAYDIRQAAEEARRMGAQVQVAYNRQHQPAFAQFAEAVRGLKRLESVSATLLRVDRKEPIFYEDVTPHPLSVLYPLLGDLTLQQASYGEEKNGIPEFLDVNLKNAAGVNVKLTLQPSSGQELELYEAWDDRQHLQLPFLPSTSPQGAGWSCSEAGVTKFHGVANPSGLGEALIPVWRMGFVPQMAGFLRDEQSANACSLDQAACIAALLEIILSRKATPS